MITDTSIREQGYLYFLAEAPELLQAIEQELFNLSEAYSTAKVHNLMRATHTIKGGAANVGLELIQSIAHSLEDAFKALYNPDLVIDSELQALLIEAYECLRLPLTSELSSCSVSINQEDVKQRAASIFAQLQEKLGDAFGTDTYIPTSIELGFDIVQSVFEMGVKQRLESIDLEIKTQQNTAELDSFLRSQLEVFIGLAESLNLPGFGAIAQTTLTALQANPAHVHQIAEIALADFVQGREVILAGDRQSGGKPSLALQNFTNVVTHVDQPSTLQNEISQFCKFLTQIYGGKKEPLKSKIINSNLKIIRYTLGWFNHRLGIAYKDLSLSQIIPDIDSENSREIENKLNFIQDWLKEFIEFIEEKQDSESLCICRKRLIIATLSLVAQFKYNNHENSITQTLQKQISELTREYQKLPPIASHEKNWLDRPKLQNLLIIKETPSSNANEPNEPIDTSLDAIWGGEITTDRSTEAITVLRESEEKSHNLAVDNQTISVKAEIVSDNSDKQENISSREAENNSEQAHKNRQHQFVRVDVAELERLNYLTGELLTYQKRRSLQDQHLKEIVEQLVQQIYRSQTTLNRLRDLPPQQQNFGSQDRQNFGAVNFEPLEMDQYTEFHLTLHQALDEILQLQETTESLSLLLQQSTQTGEKKHALLLNIIDNLVNARMLPLSNILNRFPQMVHNLANVYGKRVEMKLNGTNVLIDKAIAEKLHDPLLHLVRNAFDHGIESPEVRSNLGKPEQGLIEISAYHQGNQTVIEVRDDGQGLNFEKIYRQAIQLNLISGADNANGYLSSSTESQLLEVLFEPGFSTAAKVSEISGRGIGLDIVRSQLQALQGKVTVKSVPQQGTTFILKIPFSMTTDKLMLVQAGGTVYALLLDSLVKILLPDSEQIKEFEGKRVLHWNTGKDERMVSLRKLSNLIYYNSSFYSHHIQNYSTTLDEVGKKIPPVLLVRRNQEFVGLEVDQIIGEQELVIRPLGNALASPKYVYGCSSLANGTLILVVDTAVLIDSIEIPVGNNINMLSTSYLFNKQPLLVSSTESQESLQR
ncbi:chemotaxis protein CheA [Aetokthonos hydrillicola Thurmond2011]|jgi:chemotaxis family two-component system sensor histidine kinase/response regulator PixL|uniref:histidine kinase n=1 Tax=Aetokthonos hydrillicola Thurmond2011 TaxID=2712845 RepID=A0AAP5MAY5_9CYAN|nr:chemotaxis protein CheA [Aetokthonos hydrillicola]MBO3461447.1 chemotaxis protein CheA [Aetokthonos hydrillicola CCALA 1050]MBW4588789.1 chemotaxis protein CheA [Aetokthonos hydrillicola CCALA 1050]MDR9897347.1 chemotaxis protein CheA [Aetokthonos hydrillicola Thurmond2011]